MRRRMARRAIALYLSLCVVTGLGLAAVVACVRAERGRA